MWFHWCFSWFERVTMIVILINCITLGMYKPCADTQTCNRKCMILKVFKNFSNISWNKNYLFYQTFRLQMKLSMCTLLLRCWLKWYVCIKGDSNNDKIVLIKIALGVIGRGCYLQETWNKLDCFIVISGYIL